MHVNEGMILSFFWLDNSVLLNS